MGLARLRLCADETILQERLYNAFQITAVRNAFTRAVRMWKRQQGFFSQIL